MKIIIINRWNDKFTSYHNYIDHTEHQVAYITTENGAHWLNQNSKIIIQNNLNDFEQLLLNVNILIDGLDGIDLILAMAESDLMNAAKLRDLFELNGMGSKQTEIIKNKIAMKNHIRAKNILTPLYFDCTDRTNIAKLISTKGFPFILKPKCEAGSRGLHLIKNDEDLKHVTPQLNLPEYECEEFVDGDIYISDGIILNNKIQFIKNWKYVNSCMDFRYGQPVGAFMVDDFELNQAIDAFSAKVLEALELHSGVFHIELIRTKSNELYFLEIGARIGGGETNVVTYDLCGVNFAECWAKILTNQPLPEIHDHARIYGGILLMPIPQHTPCIVKKCTSMLNLIPCVYQEILPKAGDCINGEGSYTNTSGRFLFKGPTSASVEAAIQEVISQFQIISE